MTGHSPIRTATLSDKKNLLMIENACFAYDKISATSMHYLLTKAQAQTFVYLEHTLPVGYALLLTPKHPRPARLYSLAVHPHHQGKHIGSALIEETIRHAKKADYSTVTLEVRSSNTALISLYSRFGFVIHHSLPHYYEDGEDGMKMFLPLTHTQQ